MIAFPDSSPLNWGYWKEKYGTVRALKLYYPDSAAQLSDAVARLSKAEADIDEHFRELAKGERK